MFQHLQLRKLAQPLQKVGHRLQDEENLTSPLHLVPLHLLDAVVVMLPNNGLIYILLFHDF